MITINTQKYLDLFESKYRDEEAKEGLFYCFKSGVINSDSPEYNAMSNLIHNAEVSEDTAYRFTVEALETIIDQGEVTAKHQLEEVEAPEAPIYNSDLLDWVSEGTSHLGWVEDAINDLGWDGVGRSLITAIQYGWVMAWQSHYLKVLEAVS